MEPLTNEIKRQRSYMRSVANDTQTETETQETCTHCQGMGWISYDVPIGHPDFGKAFPCPEPDCKQGQGIAMRRYRRQMIDAGVPERYAKFSFATWDRLPKHLIEGKYIARYAAERFIDSGATPWSITEVYKEPIEYDKPRAGLVFAGQNGVGKSGLAWSIANELLLCRQSVLCISWMAALDSVQRTYRQEAQESSDQVIQTLVTAPILIIDDMHFRPDDNRPKYDRLEIAERIIRRRHERGLPYIITTNLERQGDFKAVWGRQIETAVTADCHWIIMKLPEVRSHSPEIE